MKIPAFLSLFFLVFASVAFSQATAVPHGLPSKADEPAKPILSFREVLTLVPAEISRIKATTWTQAHKDVVNDVLRKALVEPKVPAKLRLKVDEIPDWGDGVTIYSDVPNREGYHIRIFARFPDDAKSKLATLKREIPLCWKVY